jgi:hypothetical protein
MRAPWYLAVVQSLDIGTMLDYIDRPVWQSGIIPRFIVCVRPKDRSARRALESRIFHVDVWMFAKRWDWVETPKWSRHRRGRGRARNNKQQLEHATFKGTRDARCCRQHDVGHNGPCVGGIGPQHHGMCVVSAKTKRGPPVSVHRGSLL